jgi:flagellar hook-length control protein FliK
MQTSAAALTTAASPAALPKDGKAGKTGVSAFASLLNAAASKLTGTKPTEAVAEKKPPVLNGSAGAVAPSETGIDKTRKSIPAAAALAKPDPGADKAYLPTGDLLPASAATPSLEKGSAKGPDGEKPTSADAAAGIAPKTKAESQVTPVDAEPVEIIAPGKDLPAKPVVLSKDVATPDAIDEKPAASEPNPAKPLPTKDMRDQGPLRDTRYTSGRPVIAGDQAAATPVSRSTEKTPRSDAADDVSALRESATGPLSAKGMRDGSELADKPAKADAKGLPRESLSVPAPDARAASPVVAAEKPFVGPTETVPRADISPAIEARGKINGAISTVAKDGTLPSAQPQPSRDKAGSPIEPKAASRAATDTNPEGARRAAETAGARLQESAKARSGDTTASSQITPASPAGLLNSSRKAGAAVTAEPAPAASGVEALVRVGMVPPVSESVSAGVAVAAVAVGGAGEPAMDAGAGKVKPQRAAATTKREAAETSNDAAQASKSEGKTSDSALQPQLKLSEVAQQAGAKAVEIASQSPAAPPVSPDVAAATVVHGATATDTRVMLSRDFAHASAASLPMIAMRVHARDGVTRSIEIRLDPPELGIVDVKLSTGRDGKLTASFSTENGDAFQMLKGESGALEAALRDAGVDLGEEGLTFSLNDSRDGSNAPSARRDAYAGASDLAEGAADAAITPTASSWRSGVIDISV